MVNIHSDFLSGNPNFPLNLRIHPSNPPKFSSHLDINDFDHTSFGSLAQELAIRKYGIAGRVWEAAYATTLYIHPPDNLVFDPPFIDASNPAQSVTMIELGSGSGLVASSIARLLKPGRDHLIVTDLPEVCPLLELNLQSIKTQLGLESPNQDTLVVKPLSWGKLEDASALASDFFQHQPGQPNFGTLTHIICSDLVYFPELLGPLLRSLLHLSSPPFSGLPRNFTNSGMPTVLISYQLRSFAKESTFWSAFGLWFEFSPVLVKDNSAGEEWCRLDTTLDDAAYLFTAHRRSESYKWIIPPLDEDLLGGVGANGNNFRKCDDIFENLLLMSLEQN